MQGLNPGMYFNRGKPPFPSLSVHFVLLTSLSLPPFLSHLPISGLDPFIHPFPFILLAYPPLPGSLTSTLIQQLGLGSAVSSRNVTDFVVYHRMARLNDF